MALSLKHRLHTLLRWSEKYTKTDMVYLASGGFWLNLLFVLTSLAGLASTYFLTRILSQEAYGAYQYVLAGASIIGAATLTGMNSSVTRAVARGYDGDLEASVMFQLKWAFIPFLLSLGVALWYFSNGQSLLGISFVVVGCFLAITTAFNTWTAYLQGKKEFGAIFAFGAINVLLTYGSVLIVLFVTGSLVGVIITNFVSGAISNICIYWYVRRNLAHKAASERDPSTIRDGVHLSLMGISGTIANQIDAFLVFHFIGAVPLALYSLAVLLPERIGGGFKFVYTMILPRFSVRKNEELRGSVGRKLLGLMLFLGIVALGYIALAPYLFKALFPAYEAAIPMTQVMAAAIFGNATGIVQAAMTAQGRMKELYVLGIAVPMLKVFLLVTFLFSFGIWGIIWAQVLMYALSIALPLGLFYRARA